MWVILIPNEYNFLHIVNSYVCRIRHIIGYGRTIPKWNKPEILICLMGGLFIHRINRKYCCGFGCGCGALTIGAATDAASATFRVDESTTITTLPPPVPRSTRPLRRNSTTLVKRNLLSSITIRHPHRQIGHGNINKTISQLLVDPLTPRLQRSPTKSRLRRTSSSRRPLIVRGCIDKNVRKNISPKLNFEVWKL